jgi:DNA-binding NarL/FixJ family response regulator
VNVKGTIKVAVVEDDARLRRVLAEVFASAADCACAGVFRNGVSAIAGLPPLRPDVIIMDINLPDLSGVECVSRLSPQLPESQIIMLTVYQDTEMIFKALAAGAHGYLVKPVMPEDLLAAVRSIRLGGAPMSPAIARKVIDFFHRPSQAPLPAPVPDAGLGPREQQVLEQLVNGLSQKEIAAELGIGVSTVNTYMQRIYEKLHVRTRREIIALHRKLPPTSTSR